MLKISEMLPPRETRLGTLPAVYADSLRTLKYQILMSYAWELVGKNSRDGGYFEADKLASRP